MKLKSIVLTIILALFYPFTFLFRVHQNRITFISLEHDNLSKDFKILHDELSAKQEYEIKTLLFKFQPTFLGQLQYGLACIQQLFVLQSSKLVIIDYNNFVISKFLHRKEVKVLEIWHATAALKNFGNCVQRDYEIKNYDYAIANSDFYKGVYAQAFNLPEENVLVTGIPNNDKIFDDHFVQDTKVRLLEKYPVLANKKSLLMPQHFVDGSVHILKKPRLIWRACTKPWVKIMSLSTRRIHLFRVRLMRIILMSFSSKKNRSPRFFASRMF